MSTKGWVFLAVLAGCAPGAAPVSPDAIETDDGLYLIDLAATPDPVVAGEESELMMHVMNLGDEEHVQGAVVGVDPFMPEHGHGIEDDVEVTEPQMGMYVAAWTYTMSGYWEVTIDVDADAGADSVVVGYDVF